MVSKVGTKKIVIEYRILLEGKTTKDQWEDFWRPILEVIKYNPFFGEQLFLQLCRYKDNKVYLLAIKVLAKTHTILCQLGYPPTSSHATKLWKKLLSIKGLVRTEAVNEIKKFIQEQKQATTPPQELISSLLKLVD